jgi:hypothetical protein
MMLKVVSVRVTFENGDRLFTRLNGTLKDAREYYLGNVFQLGLSEDTKTRAIKVEKEEVRK